jgi:hypothetical protein
MHTHSFPRSKVRELKNRDRVHYRERGALRSSEMPGSIITLRTIRNRGETNHKFKGVYESESATIGAVE